MTKPLDQPRVSVLMTVRNAAPTLKAALISISRQTLTDIEVIIVNDGSIDGSGAILDSWASRDARFRVVHIARCGLVSALNAGLAACRAPLVARMDADDISHPRRFEEQAALLDARPEVGVVSCLVRVFPRRGLGEGSRLYEAWLNSLTRSEDIFRERFVESSVAHPSVMIRRELLDSLGGYRDQGWAEDYDLWLRLMERGVGFTKLDRPLLFWREHPGRLTRRDRRYSVDNFLRCKAHFLVRGPLTGGTPVILWGAGQTGRRMSRHLRREGADIVGVIDIDPRRIGSTLHGASIISPDDLVGSAPDGGVVLAAVASRGARELIRKRLVAFGYTEGVDFWCVA